MASNQMTITGSQHETLMAVKSGANDVHQIAEQIGKSVATVRGTLRALRDNGLVDGISGGLQVTSDGEAFAVENQGNQSGGNQQTQGRQAQGGNQGGGNGGDTKIDQARQLFQQHVQEGRARVLEAFQQEAGLTYAGASTYYQKIRGEMGYANQNGRAQANNQGNRGGNRAGNNQGNRGGNRAGAAGNNQGEQLNSAGNRRGMNRNSGNRTSGAQRAGGNQSGNRGGNRGNAGNSNTRGGNRAR